MPGGNRALNPALSKLILCWRGSGTIADGRNHHDEGRVDPTLVGDQLLQKSTTPRLRRPIVTCTFTEGRTL
jgi:hypothetical protein